MTSTLTLNIDTPIMSINMVDESPPVQIEPDLQQILTTNEQLDNTSIALDQVILEFKRLRDEVFSSHAEQIARLSVEIARRILQKDIKKEKYDIENIIQKILKNVPGQQDIVVRLNPKDLERYNEAVGDDRTSLPSSAKFVADPSINPAECIVESDKGLVEYLIEEHLNQIETALNKQE